jgi:predicted Zn-dependent protease
MTAPVSPALANFEKMLAAGRDGALLRYSLGNEYLKAGDAARAAEHLACAVALDPKYTAAWKLYGKALAGAGRRAEALAAYREGIAVAHARGDKQAEKEMTVFARRIERDPGTRRG